jgi:hypothetical protein
VERTAAVGVPLLEASVSALVVAGLPRVAGIAAAALLVAFSAAILVARARRGNRLPCGCFGGRRMRDFRAMLGRNALLAAVSLVVALGASDAAVSTGVALPHGADVLPAALVVVSLAVAAWTLAHGLHLLRRIDR